MIGPSAGGASSQPTRNPVIASSSTGLDEQNLVVRRHHVMERGRAGAVVGQAAVDLVGDDPEVLRASESERRREFLAGGDKAGRIGREFRKMPLSPVSPPRRAGRRRGSSALPAKRDRNGARARSFDRTDEFGRRATGSAPRRPRQGQAHGDLDRMHAADGGEEASGRNGRRRRRAIDASHVAAIASRSGGMPA